VGGRGGVGGEGESEVFLQAWRGQWIQELRNYTNLKTKPHL